MGCWPRHHIPDTVCRSTLSSHSVSADGIVFRHNLHCICSRRGWKSPLRQTLGVSVFFHCTRRPSALRAFSPSLHSCPHLLGGKAWISPFPLSLPLKRSLLPSHLAPLLISSPPSKPLCTFIKKDIFLVVVPARSVL